MNDRCPVVSTTTMETYCTSGGHSSKFRPSISGNSFYQTETYGKNYRDEYSFMNSTRNSALLWHERPHPSSAKNRGKMCSIALIATAFIVLIAVLSIGGLALYMGSLMSDSPSYLLTYNCNAKLIRGDRFIGALQEKSKRYKAQLHALYQRSVIGPALISCNLDHFGNDTYTIFYKVTLNRRKIPRQVHNVEKTIKDILLTDAINKKPIFRNLRFDSRSVRVQQQTPPATTNTQSETSRPQSPAAAVTSSPHQRVFSKYNDPAKPTSVVLKQPPNRMNLTVTAELPMRRKPSVAVVEKQVISEEVLPVIQGSFTISKTEADITEKKNTTVQLSTVKPKSQVTEASRPTTKETSVTSAMYKIVAVEKVTSATSTTITTTTTTTTTTATTSQAPSTNTTISEESLTITPVIDNTPLRFAINPNIFNQDPWVPIYKDGVAVVATSTTPATPVPLAAVFNHPKFYTSFTNPGLSHHASDIEALGSTSVKGHPIPVNKIQEITESATIAWEDAEEEVAVRENVELELELPDLNKQESNESSSGLVEVETLMHVPGSAMGGSLNGYGSGSKWEFINGTSSPNSSLESIETVQEPPSSLIEEPLKNISTIFNTIASLPTLPTKEIIDIKNISESDNGKPSLDSEEVVVSGNGKNPWMGEGQVEVVDVDELALIAETTKLPLVTLLPVKSNSGVGRPIRPRPLSSENRSFSKASIHEQEINDTDLVLPYAGIVASSTNKPTFKQHQLSDFKIVGLLNFQTDVPVVMEKPAVTSEIKSADIGDFIHRDPKLEERGGVNVTESYSDVAVVNISSSNNGGQSKVQYLTPEKLKELSEISKVTDGNSTKDSVPSTKAVHTSYTINNNGFKTLTKTLNKIPVSSKESYNSEGSFNSFSFSTYSNKTECSNFTLKCGDGQCLPETSRCNQLVDCNDGADEKHCKCSDYLRSQFLLRKICDGIVDCWDFSDENNCDWCSPGQYVCGNSKLCIDRSRICDGIRDCPYGDDERQCVTVAPTIHDADEFPYHRNGYLMVRKHGEWGKLCVERFSNIAAQSQTQWELADLGKAVCKAMTYQKLNHVKIVTETKSKQLQHFELTYSTTNNKTKQGLSFEETPCDSGQVVKVQCLSLECGTRPQAINKSAARIVGGGNAGIGAWPWQAAMYKEGEFQCGATLISERWLLSAGHCFYHSLDEHWVARLGALRRGTSLPSPYEQLRPIARIVLHPGYVDVGFINDISLLQMATAVVFSDYVRPICLPDAGIPPQNGRICTVIGWGQLFEVGRIFPDTLQEVQVPVISTAECRARTLFLPLYRVTDDMFCAGFDRGGRDACLGDSGGPLMCAEPDGRWQLHGITSNGYGCARPHRPGVYTTVANYVDWIDSYVVAGDGGGESSGDGGASGYSDDASADAEAETEAEDTTVDRCLGHRCPLGKCLPKSRLCNGFVECSDRSDEVRCL